MDDIEKRGTLRVVLLSIRDYVRLAVPEPEVLRIIGKESKQKGANKLSARQIDQIIKAARRSALKPEGLQPTVVLLALTKPARWYALDAILSEYAMVLARPRFKI